MLLLKITTLVFRYFLITYLMISSGLSLLTLDQPEQLQNSSMKLSPKIESEIKVSKEDSGVQAV